MANVKVTNSLGIGNNKGSCAEVLNFIEQKSEWKPASCRDSFFSPADAYILPHRVADHLDHYGKSLKADEHKFYVISITFPTEELQHINNENIKSCIEGFRQYVLKVMAAYAKGFSIAPDSLLWYAKVDWEPMTRDGIPVYDVEIHILVSALDMFRNRRLFVNTTGKKLPGEFDVKEFNERAADLYKFSKKWKVSEVPGAATDAEF